MFGLGTPEIIVILVIALVLFGPKKFPEIGRAIGQGIREIRSASQEVLGTLGNDSDKPERSEEVHNNAPDSHDRHS